MRTRCNQFAPNGHHLVQRNKDIHLRDMGEMVQAYGGKPNREMRRAMRRKAKNGE